MNYCLGLELVLVTLFRLCGGFGYQFQHVTKILLGYGYENKFAGSPETPSLVTVKTASNLCFFYW